MRIDASEGRYRQVPLRLARWPPIYGRRSSGTEEGRALPPPDVASALCAQRVQNSIEAQFSLRPLIVSTLPRRRDGCRTATRPLLARNCGEEGFPCWSVNRSRLRATRQETAASRPGG
jgi:hypothetical protein